MHKLHSKQPHDAYPNHDYLFYFVYHFGRRRNENWALSGPTVGDAGPSSSARSETAAAAAATGGKADESRGSTATERGGGGGGGGNRNIKAAGANNDIGTSLTLPASVEGVHTLGVVDRNGTGALAM